MSRNSLPASLIDKLPEMSGIYLLYQSTILVYIGKATNLRTRVPHHTKNKTFDEIEFETTHWSRARQLEKELLKDYFKRHNQYPFYNKQG